MVLGGVKELHIWCGCRWHICGKQGELDGRAASAEDPGAAEKQPSGTCCGRLPYHPQPVPHQPAPGLVTPKYGHPSLTTCLLAPLARIPCAFLSTLVLNSRMSRNLVMFGL